MRLVIVFVAVLAVGLGKLLLLMLSLLLLFLKRTVFFHSRSNSSLKLNVFIRFFTPAQEQESSGPSTPAPRSAAPTANPTANPRAFQPQQQQAGWSYSLSWGQQQQPMKYQQRQQQGYGLRVPGYDSLSLSIIRARERTNV